MSCFEALADPTRREIVELLSDGEQSAGAIAGRFTMSRPAVSRHLAVLVEHEVIEVRASGRQRWFRLRPESLRAGGDWLSAQAERWTRALDTLEESLDDGRI